MRLLDRYVLKNCLVPFLYCFLGFIAMLTAGQSVTRVLAPLFGLGIVAALVSLVLNYELAPHAEASKKMLLDELHEKKKQTTEQQLFRNRADGRTWYVQDMPPRKRGVIG